MKPVTPLDFEFMELVLTNSAYKSTLRGERYKHSRCIKYRKIIPANKIDNNRII